MPHVLDILRGQYCVSRVVRAILRSANIFERAFCRDKTEVKRDAIIITLLSLYIIILLRLCMTMAKASPHFAYYREFGSAISNFFWPCLSGFPRPKMPCSVFPFRDQKWPFRHYAEFRGRLWCPPPQALFRGALWSIARESTYF